LTRLRAALGKGLEATDAAWPEIRGAFTWVRRLAAVLTNRGGHDAAAVRTRFDATVASLARHREALGSLAGALGHFRKVTRSYRPGLFGCYDVADLPRTNNDLEQFFGSYRYHERRCSGRKVASPGTVVRGSVRLVAAAATRLRPVGVADLIPSHLPAWRALRDRLGRRQAVRTLGRRFRQDPKSYLRSLEDSIINQALPS
jgi:hypothetical protein